MKTKLLLFAATLLMTAMGVQADDAFFVWDEANTTLYFSYGAVPTEGESWTPAGGSAITATEVWSGTHVTSSPTNEGPRWNKSWINSKATKVVFESSFASVKPTSCHYWFLNFACLTTIEGLEYLDTSECTTMQSMFQNIRVSVLDLSNFDTSKVTNMEGMFCDCPQLKTIIVGNDWNTSAVTNSDDMFYNCLNIIGEDGTSVGSTIDKTYAHTGAGGYLTKKSVTVAANTVGSDNWATYYKSNVNRKADANTTVYTAAIAGDKLTLTEVADKNIEAGQAVILKSTAATITLTSNTDAPAADFSANELKGTDADEAAPENTYVLGNGTSGVGFYKYTGTLGANKAYITYGAGSRDFIGFSNVTGIKDVRNNLQENSTYYDLNGHRVLSPTKGLYIVNGKKVVMK